jgi:hypothetical protein
LKQKIDDIALEMIEQTEKYQAIYLNGLKENFSSFEHIKSLENELNDIEDTFRNPNLLIETIRAIQQRQEASLKDIQFKLFEMNQVKEFCEEKNGISSFNQNEGNSLFGSMKLNKLCEFSPNDKWTLLYRGTRDCFGGYASVDWDSSSKWKSGPNAFIFSLTNKDNQTLKIRVYPSRLKYAIHCGSHYGPTFGNDIQIANNAKINKYNFSYLGDSYKHPKYAYNTNEAQTFLAGSCQFQLDEIEVYQKE